MTASRQGMSAPGGTCSRNCSDAIRFSRPLSLRRHGSQPAGTVRFSIIYRVTAGRPIERGHGALREGHDAVDLTRMPQVRDANRARQP